LEVNPGERFLFFTNTNQSSLYRSTEDGQLLDNPLLSIGISSRPSITDDGSFAVFVDDQNRLRIYYFASGDLEFLEETPQNIWRNVAVSKDGSRIAAVTTEYDNRILIYDFATADNELFELYNPTSAIGVQTGDVRFADALEWTPNGQYLMYDALSRINSTFGDAIQYYDIGFLRAWNSATNTVGDGSIIKLFSNLPEGISIGNPTLARNSDYIIAYEEVDFENEVYSLVTENIEQGTQATLINNGVVNYPNFGIADDRLVFNARTESGSTVLATIPLAEDKISAQGNASALINGGRWGVYYATGERNLETATADPLPTPDWRIAPNPFTDHLDIILTEEASGPVRAELIDPLGRRVRQTQLSGSGPHRWPINNLPRGTYTLRLTAGQQHWVQPVIHH
jgi:hypothetical protein